MSTARRHAAQFWGVLQLGLVLITASLVIAALSTGVIGGLTLLATIAAAATITTLVWRPTP